MLSCNKKRCSWVNLKNKKYIQYHDSEWGVPLYDDRKLFEMLSLEIFQAGLSWECVLNKRDEFKKAFDNFNSEIIIKYSENKINSLLNDSKIIRNKSKILAVINNADIFLKIQNEFKTFSNYIWHFTDNKVIYENDKIKSELSDEISKDLKKRGMKFLGSITIYSYLQAIGVIYSHEAGCFLEKK